MSLLLFPDTWNHCILPDVPNFICLSVHHKLGFCSSVIVTLTVTRIENLQFFCNVDLEFWSLEWHIFFSFIYRLEVEYIFKHICLQQFRTSPNILHILFLKHTLSIPDDKTERDLLNYEAMKKDTQIFVSLTCAKGFTIVYSLWSDTKHSEVQSSLGNIL